MSLHDSAFYVSLSLLIGIFLGVVYPEMSLLVTIGFIVLISLFTLLISFISENKKFWVSLSMGGLLILGGFIYGSGSVKREEGTFPIIGELADFSGIVASEPEIKGKSLSFNLALNVPYKGDIKIYTDIFSDIKKGDRMSFHGLAEKTAYGAVSSFFPEVKSKESSASFGLLFTLNSFKKKMVAGMEKYLPREEAALGAGMTLGERGLFSSAFKENLNKSGTTHIVALSGFNITILVAAAGLIFGYFFGSTATFFITLLAVAIFVLMVGVEASVVRAAIMGIIALLSLQVGRLYSFRNAIAISALAMALYNPTTLIDVGFELSFMSLIGIVYLLPAIKNVLKIKSENSILNWKENMLATFSAQTAVMPISLFYFGSFSVFSFIPNILILEAVPYAMLGSFVVGLLSTLGIAGEFLAWLSSWPTFFILKYQTAAIDFFAAKSVLFQMENLGVWIFPAYYLFISWVAYNYRDETR